MIFTPLMNRSVLVFQAGAGQGCWYQLFAWCQNHTTLYPCNSIIAMAAQAIRTAISTALDYVNVNGQWGVAYSHTLAGYLGGERGLNPDNFGQEQGSLPIPDNRENTTNWSGTKNK